MLEKLRRWMNGTFVCTKCGKEYHTMTFGFGEAICPDCYQGEKQFIIFDTSYWLNRITAHLLRQKPQRRKPDIDHTLTNQIHTHPEIEIA